MAAPGPPLSEDDAATAQTLATSMYGGRRCHWGKVGVDLDLWKVGLFKKELRYYSIRRHSATRPTVFTGLFFCDKLPTLLLPYS